MLLHVGSLLDANLEASRAPFHEVEGGLGFQCSNCSIAVTWHAITSVEQTASHIFALYGIAYHHLVVWLEAWQLSAETLVGRSYWYLHWNVNSLTLKLS
jgi:hypothetical protein